MIVADEKDLEIFQARLAKWQARTGPCVGDYVLMLDGTVRRFTHDWGDSLQTTSPNLGLGSFYLGDGYMTYSGALEAALPKSSLRDTGKTHTSYCWFFHHDSWGADRAVDFPIPCRVYEQVE